MPSAEQKAGNSEPFQQMLALEPRLEFSLAAGAAVVPDRQDSWTFSSTIVVTIYFAATTMISTL